MASGYTSHNSPCSRNFPPTGIIRTRRQPSPSGREELFYGAYHIAYATNRFEVFRIDSLPRQFLKLEIKRLIIEALDLEDTAPEDIDDDAPLFGDEGLGLDSIDALELGIALRKKYQIQLEANDAGNREHFRSVSNLAKLVQSHAQAV